MKTRIGTHWGRLVGTARRFLTMTSTVAFCAAVSAPAWAQGITTLVSVSSDGVQGDGPSEICAISGDGRFVAFASRAALVPGDTNEEWDIFVHDRATGATTRVSVSSEGVQGNDWSDDPAISVDGRFVAFWSSATNLVAGDSNEVEDVFVHDRATGTTTRVSVSTAGLQGNDVSDGPAISADGRFIAFQSEASNLVTGDTNGFQDVFVHDRVAGTTTRVSVSSEGLQGGGRNPAISGDGRFVAFISSSSLVSGDTNAHSDMFVHDRETGITTLVSVSSEGVQGDNEVIFVPAISADGRMVAFTSAASNLVPGDTNGMYDVFVHDRETGTTTRVSVGSGGVQGNSTSQNPALSADGRFATFNSYATNLVADDTNGCWDVFVHDRETGITTRVSVSSDGTEGWRNSYFPAISGNGRFVAFTSQAFNLVAADTNGIEDVFVHDRGDMARATLPAGDYDGDGQADVAVYRPSSGVWFVIPSGTGTGVGIQWGLPDDVPVPADYDGDGNTDVAVYRPSTGVWYILPSSTGTAIGLSWGLMGDIPVPADYDGDGQADPSVFRPSTGTWYQLRSTNGEGYGVQWGISGDVPVVADFDGDGKADPTVFRASTGTWYQLRSTTGEGFGVSWGQSGDVPAPGDFDGDGKADPTVFRASTGTWYQFLSTKGEGSAVHWGAPGDVAMMGDYDGDGKADPTVYRAPANTWFVLRSTIGIGVGILWGAAGDLPI